ncbi:MAG: alanine racemase [Gammaproteobacteria bacterium]|nr:alanine racemase [Gammaproteobacteria bacterium]
MIPGPRAHIDLSALEHNFQISRRHTPNARQIVVIKANGYGHGMVQVAQALHDADAFAVARLAEAIYLREAGITKPVLLLEGVLDIEELQLAQRHQIDLVVHCLEQVNLLIQATGSAINVWLKVDTGMHRLGLNPANVSKAFQELTSCEIVNKPVRLMTHLANADDRQDNLSQQQCDTFKKTCVDLTSEHSIANSAGILGWPTSHTEWVRPGIMLYGSSPFVNDTAANWDLHPVMTLSTSLIAVQDYKKGDAIGYGGSWNCPEDMRVGVAAIGYGDGYPRHASNGAPVLINDQRCEVVGRVSMDMICIDLRNSPGASVGDTVVLWGKGLPAEEVANRAGTITYELFCRLTSRVKFTYQN